MRELFSSGGREPVVLELSIPILGHFPFRGHPALLFETVQRG